MRGFETSEHQPLVNPDDWSRQGPVVWTAPALARQVGDLWVAAEPMRWTASTVLGTYRPEEEHKHD